MRSWGPLSVTACICLLQPVANAQAPRPEKFDFVALSPRSVETDPGSTISLAFSVQSNSADSLTFAPAVVMPDGWSVITGAETFSLAPRRTDTWIMSIFVPARAENGQYYLHIGARIPSHDSLDTRQETIQVAVRRKRGLVVNLIRHPEYVVSGNSYDVAFRVQNRGNGVADVHISAQSLLDSAPAVKAGVLHLRAETDTIVSIRVRTPTSGTERSDDVVQLSATERVAEADSAAASASAHVTVVQAAGSQEPLATVPTTIGLRAASADAGVSPIELRGRGKLRPDRDEFVDFVLHGKSGLNSPFGDERDNRLEISSPAYHLRLGDNVFTSSTLTTMGQIGFGAGLELSGGVISGGAYSQRFRYTPGNQAEHAVKFALNPEGLLSGYRLSFNAVDRTGGPRDGKILSSALRLPFANQTVLDAELAGSNGDAGRGYANSVRVIGGGSFRYDLGHIGGDSVFAGPTRNMQNDYANFSVPTSSNLVLSGTVNRSRFAAGSDSTLPRQEFAGGAIGAIYDGRVSLEFSGIGRTIGGQRWRLAETQRYAQARVDQPSRYGNSWFSLEMGERGDSASSGGTYHLLQLGTSVNASFTSLSVYTELYDGGSITRGLAGMSTVGGSASIHLAGSTTLSLFGYAARNHVADARAYSQLDAQVAHGLANGSRLSLRVRSATTVLGLPAQKLAYAEYSFPIGLPTGRVPRPGRATGIVTDGESGRAISGVLVRVGPQAGVTDRNGRVSFAGLLPGEYRASLASEASISNAAYVGNPVVRIDSTRRDAATFQLAVSRAARIRGTVRQFTTARTAVGDEADSLLYSGPAPALTIGLVAGSDTLYRVTDQTGQFSFDEVAGAQWTVFVESEVPAGAVVEHPRVAVTTKPGDELVVDFRIIPKRKRVKFVGDAR